MPVPDRDFDVTEVAVPWRLLTDAGHQVVFATERAGTRPACDPRLLTGVLFGQLGAEHGAEALLRRAHAQRGVHRDRRAGPSVDPGRRTTGCCCRADTRPACGSTWARRCCSSRSAAFWALERPVGAICHGVLVLGAGTGPRPPAAACWRTGARPACRSTWNASAYLATAWRLGRYYRTYPAYVEDEVRAALDGPAAQLRAGAAGSSPSAAPRPTTPPRSSSRTAAISRRAGRATPTSSGAVSVRSWKPDSRPAPARRWRPECVRVLS